MILRNQEYFLLCSYFDSILLFALSVIKSYDVPESINPAEMLRFGANYWCTNKIKGKKRKKKKKKYTQNHNKLLPLKENWMLK